VYVRIYMCIYTYIFIYTYAYMYIYIYIYDTYNRRLLQGGKDSLDALSCRSFSAKERLIIGLFCGKWPKKIRHPMTLRHPVCRFYVCMCVCVYVCIYTCVSIYVSTYTYTYIHTYICFYIYIYIHTYIYMYIYDTCKSQTDTGWLRLVGSTRLYVSFAKEPY